MPSRLRHASPLIARAAMSLLFTTLTGAAARGAEPASAPTPLSFERDVRPILTTHCVKCHGGEATKAGLDLTTAERLAKGAKSGPVVIPGSAGQSLIVQLLADGADPHMPPKKQLSEGEIAKLAAWVNAMSPAAPPTARPITDADRAHWSFQPRKQVEPPAVKQAEWVRSPIDAFILTRLESTGLSPAAPATKAELIRRATFDLTGLPPTPEEVDAFERDDSAGAYEALIDRLLASPRYGERWGRHWLDLVRYADSGGFHNDLDRPHAWRYRDYVIKSLNDDKPYAAFVREQLAGDELARDNAEALAATGFIRNGPSNEDNMGMGLAPERYRLDQLDDVISTTSAVFLGLTVGCARCHDHKIDPIPQADYYRLLAVFNNTTPTDIPLDADGAPDWSPKAITALKKPPKGTKVEAVMAATDSSAKPRTTNLLWRGDAANKGPEVQPGVPTVLPGDAVAFPNPPAGAKSTGRRTALAEWVVAPENPLTWRVIANRAWHYHFGRGLVATPSDFGFGGDRPTHPELLDWLADELLKNGGRLKPLHRLIMTSATYRQSSRYDERTVGIDPNNALLWRVAPRRLEAEAIRDAILATAGTLNENRGGPGVKPRIPADMLATSQRNKWPLVKTEGPEHWRRSVYVYVKRQLPFPMLELFDAPAATSTCARRTESTVPTQALVLMNDQFTQEQAAKLAERVSNEAGDEPKAQAKRALRLTLSRQPTEQRVAEAVEFLSQQRTMHEQSGKLGANAGRLALADLCHVLFNCNEFAYVE